MSSKRKNYYTRTVHTSGGTKKVRCKMPKRPKKYKKQDKKRKTWRNQTTSSRPKGQKENLKRDYERKAKRPGYRKSHGGKTYYEARKNRSDAKGKRI